MLNNYIVNIIYLSWFLFSYHDLFFFIMILIFLSWFCFFIINFIMIYFVIMIQFFFIMVLSWILSWFYHDQPNFRFSLLICQPCGLIVFLWNKPDYSHRFKAFIFKLIMYLMTNFSTNIVLLIIQVDHVFNDQLFN